MIDIAISLALLYLMVAGVVSGLQEVWASLRQKRGRMLQRGIDSVLQGERAPSGGQALLDLLYAHPSIEALKDGKRLPSYLSAATFANAFADVLVRDTGAARPLFEGLPEATTRLPEHSPLRRQLELLITQSAGDAALLQKAVEAHYDEVMARVSGWYKREAQQIGFVLALLVAMLFNIDSLAIGSYLKSHPEDARRLADQAGEVLRQTETRPLDSATHTNDPALTATLNQNVRALRQSAVQLRAQHFPLGWPWCRVSSRSDESCAVKQERENQAEAAQAALAASLAASAPADAASASQATAASAQLAALPGGASASAPAAAASAAAPRHLQIDGPDSWLFSLLGWLVTALAALVGAPFWFDLLSRLIPLRGSGRKPESSPPPAPAAPPVSPAPARQGGCCCCCKGCACNAPAATDRSPSGGLPQADVPAA